jgi:lysophospholipase
MNNNNYEYFETQDGARLRYGFWPAYESCIGESPPKTVIIFQGRASFIEKFDVAMLGLQKRGYDVWAFDWRGQGLSTRLLPERHKGHIDSYDTYLRDIHELLHTKILPRMQGTFIVLGQSMGSHLALRYIMDHPGIFDIAVLTAPLFDLNTGGYSTSMARFICQTACRIGLGESFVLGHDVYDPRKEPFEGNMLTHNRATFFHHRLMQKNNPDLSIGGVTYQWVDATFQSIDILMQPEKIQNIKIPVLIISAGQEVVVDNSRVEQVASWLPRGSYVLYPEARHQILSETPEIMAQFWQDFESFVEGNVIKAPNNKLELPERGFIKAAQFAGMERLYPALPDDFKRLDPNF